MPVADRLGLPIDVSTVQRLDLDQQRPLTLDRGEHDRSRDPGLAVGQEQPTRVGQPHQPRPRSSRTAPARQSDRSDAWSPAAAVGRDDGRPRTTGPCPPRARAAGGRPVCPPSSRGPPTPWSGRLTWPGRPAGGRIPGPEPSIRASSRSRDPRRSGSSRRRARPAWSARLPPGWPASRSRRRATARASGPAGGRPAGGPGRATPRPTPAGPAGPGRPSERAPGAGGWTCRCPAHRRGG